MHVIRIASPAPPLREFVRFYAHRTVRIKGDAVVHLVPARAFPLLEFVFGDRFQQVSSSDQSLIQTSPRVVVVGVQTHCRSRLRFSGRVECFVILFQPTGLHRLFSTPGQEITDRAYDAYSVLGALVSRLEQVLGDTDNFIDRVRLADNFLLPYSLRARDPGPVFAASSGILRASGNTRITALAREAGVSVRQLERSFSQQIGVHPKLFARIVRFEAALDRKARSSARSWTEVAHEFGYCDQMHMVHDFGEFSGGTPAHMLKEFEEVFRGQIEAVRAGRGLVARDDLEFIV